jgi:MFS family permease
MLLNRDLALIYLAAFLRSLGIGLIGVVLGVYLFRVGLSSTQIGFTIGAGLAGAALGLFFITFYGNSFGRRRTLFALSILAALGGIGLSRISGFVALLPLAFLCMLNAMGTDRTAAFALEQAVIPDLIRAEQRTWALSWYNLVLDLGHALGALSAATPLVLQKWLQTDLISSYKFVFIGYGLLNLISGVLYLFLTDKVELAAPVPVPRGSARLLPGSKRIVRKLAALSSIDSFGGGFLTDAIVAYWFFRRFGVQEQGLGLLFFVVHIANAASYLGAAWLGRRIGLLKTMVFTHLPSSLFLIAVPLAPSFKFAALLLLIREALVEMDVPTRQSYIAAVVRPSERTFASGVTNLTRNVSWATASSMVGVVMQYVGFSAPLIAGGGLKITYDLLLYRAFRNLKPPEELGTKDKRVQATRIEFLCNHNEEQKGRVRL